MLPPPICAVYDAYLRVPSGCQHRGDGLAQTLQESSAVAQGTSAPRAPCAPRACAMFACARTSPARAHGAECARAHTRGHKPSAVLRREGHLAAVEKLLVLVLVEQVAVLRPRCRQAGMVEAQVAQRSKGALVHAAVHPDARLGRLGVAAPPRAACAAERAPHVLHPALAPHCTAKTVCHRVPRCRSALTSRCPVYCRCLCPARSDRSLRSAGRLLARLSSEKAPQNEISTASRLMRLMQTHRLG